MAAQLLEADLPQLLETWKAVVIEGAKKVGLTYDRFKILKYRISKEHKNEPRILTSHDALGFDVAGSSDRRRTRP